MALHSEMELNSEMELDSERVLDSEMAPDSVEVVPDSVDVVSDSVELVPDSVESPCARCDTFHAGGVFREACFQARREARKCARCRLVHDDYDLTTWMLDKIEKFDCELYIPYVEKLEMDGDTILVPEHVQMKFDEIYNMKKLEDAKKKQDAQEQHSGTCLIQLTKALTSMQQRLTCLHLLICYRETSNGFSK
jgi:hypothetical protein